MTRREHPTVLEHLAIGGLRPEILEDFRGRRKQRSAGFIYRFVRFRPVAPSLAPGSLTCIRCRASAADTYEALHAAGWHAGGDGHPEFLCPRCVEAEA